MRSMDFYLIIVCAWAILGNIWHAILLIRTKSKKRLPTISEHAVEDNRLLRVHRLVHSLPLLVFMPAVFGYLLPNGYGLAAGLLLSGVFFDCVETLTLNKRTATLAVKLNVHFVTAWLMALSYFGYALVISRIAHVSPWVYGPVLGLCLLLVVLANKGVSRQKSLAMQMTYFMLVTLAVVIAHIRLVLS